MKFSHFIFIAITTYARDVERLSERSRVLIISEREPGKQSRKVKEMEVDETPGNKK